MGCLESPWWLAKEAGRILVPNKAKCSIIPPAKSKKNAAEKVF
jgi:hypothetical protein